MKGGLLVAGTTSDAGKSWVVTGLCRLLARRGVRVAPFKGQNMALNARVTADGGEIGHAQWVQARAAGVEAEVAMNPVLLKPTGERTSQVVVLGRVVGERDARTHHASKADLRPVVLDALEDLRSRFDVVVCEGAGGAAEINLLEGDLANLPLARAAGLPTLIVGDIERGGVFASLYGTVGLLPDELRAHVRGFVINRFRGDPSLLDAGLVELERRCGVPTLGVVPLLDGADLDAEDSLAFDRLPSRSAAAADLDVVAIRYPHVSNFGDLDPLVMERGVQVRWVRSAGDLGRPHLVVLPGSKSTRTDLAWLRERGLDDAVLRSGAPVLAICAGAQMAGATIEDLEGVEGPPGSAQGLGLLALRTSFERDKVLDRPTVDVIDGPGTGCRLSGYRIHNGRVAGDAAIWLRHSTGETVGWWGERTCATTVHGILEDDGLRGALLSWVSERAGRGVLASSGWSFEGARQARFDAIADALEAHLDLERLFEIVAEGASPAVAR